MSSSTQMFQPEWNTASLSEDQDSPQIQFQNENQYGYCRRSPSVNDLINFGRAKYLYILNNIQYSILITPTIPVVSSVKENLRRLDMASQLLIESNENYRESLAEENRIYGEILEENFFFELPPIKSYKAEAKIDRFEIVLPDTSDIEEF